MPVLPTGYTPRAPNGLARAQAALDGRGCDDRGLVAQSSPQIMGREAATRAAEPPCQPWFSASSANSPAPSAISPASSPSSAIPRQRVGARRVPPTSRCTEGPPTSRCTEGAPHESRIRVRRVAAQAGSLRLGGKDQLGGKDHESTTRVRCILDAPRRVEILGLGEWEQGAPYDACEAYFGRTTSPGHTTSSRRARAHVEPDMMRGRQPLRLVGANTRAAIGTSALSKSLGILAQRTGLDGYQRFGSLLVTGRGRVMVVGFALRREGVIEEGGGGTNTYFSFLAGFGRISRRGLSMISAATMTQKARLDVRCQDKSQKIARAVRNSARADRSSLLASRHCAYALSPVIADAARSSSLEREVLAQIRVGQQSETSISSHRGPAFLLAGPPQHSFDQPDA
ncbi:uncharacterized protein SCHCODRAFT_02517983 [Schizophyllum commune H4-8]|uniref:Uncharacterized protein n=1 Tax=Schizophyllum commune (strain H4-8 / FGSC 9210) TaxID=578458 RepID=D8QJC9_SCHCM|nr:uncharacterized protein SCHCODRAFT_02517983 [Schizophyllum commune H4-8]KAI5886382.1 hypothetical protein SCHCODRAFT_02517983 [Schizophyllum commune H4-8]